MTDGIDKKTDLDDAELKKVAATAEAKQLRHRVDVLLKTIAVE